MRAVGLPVLSSKNLRLYVTPQINLTGEAETPNEATEAATKTIAKNAAMNLGVGA